MVKHSRGLPMFTTDSRPFTPFFRTCNKQPGQPVSPPLPPFISPAILAVWGASMQNPEPWKPLPQNEINANDKDKGKRQVMQLGNKRRDWGKFWSASNFGARLLVKVWKPGKQKAALMGVVYSDLHEGEVSFEGTVIYVHYICIVWMVWMA